MKSMTGEFLKNILAANTTFYRAAKDLEYEVEDNGDEVEIMATTEIDGYRQHTHLIFDAPIKYLDWMLSYCLVFLYQQHFEDNENVAKGNRENHPTRVSLHN